MREIPSWADLPSHLVALSESFIAATFVLIEPCPSCGDGRPGLGPCVDCAGSGMRAYAFASAEEARAYLGVGSPPDAVESAPNVVTT
jgi:hypothetical protein